MGTMSPHDLLRKWRLEVISTEMATGHIVQNLVNIQTAIDALNITAYNLRADLDSLITHTGMPPDTKGAKKKPSQTS